jgi:hypothetical protein
MDGRGCSGQFCVGREGERRANFNVFSRTGNGNRSSGTGEDGRESKNAPAYFGDEKTEYRRFYIGDNLPFFFLFSASGRPF